MNLRDISIIADIIKICYICFFVYYTNFKIINIKYNIRKQYVKMKRNIKNRLTRRSK